MYPDTGRCECLIRRHFESEPRRFGQLGNLMISQLLATTATGLPIPNGFGSCDSVLSGAYSTAVVTPASDCRSK